MSQQVPRIENRKVIRVRDQHRPPIQQVPICKQRAASAEKFCFVYELDLRCVRSVLHVLPNQVRVMMQVHHDPLKSGTIQEFEPIAEEGPAADRCEAFRQHVGQWTQARTQSCSE